MTSSAITTRRCPTGKVRYRTLWLAQLNVARLMLEGLAGDERRHENRAYRCPECGGCHVTSKPELHRGRR